MTWKRKLARSSRFFRLRAFPLFALATLHFLASSRACSQEPSLEGKPVAAVRVVDAAGNPIPQKIGLLALHPGAAFHIDAEQLSLRELNQSGLFSDVSTRAMSEADGLHVDFVVVPNFYNNVARIIGLKDPPNEASALAALHMPLGEPFQLSALEEGLRRLSQTLQDDGFYEASIHYGLARHPETQQIDITVEVDPGPRAKVSDVGVDNQTPFPGQQLLKHAKISKGISVTSERIERSVERLRNYLVADGYLGARVAALRGKYDPNTRTLPVTLDVTAGPRVRVEVSGAKISPAEMRKLVPIYEEGDVDPDLLEEGLRNIRDMLQKKAYFDSTATYATHVDPATQTEVIQFTVDLGIRHRLVGIEIEGNKYFNTELLKSRLLIQPQSFGSRGRFSQAMVRTDADSIRGLYLSNGFLQSQVQPEVEDNYQGKEGNIFVIFHISERQQTRVASLQLEGNHALTSKQLLTVIGSTPGQPYSEVNVTSDRDNVLAYYFDQGFPNAQFEVKATPAGADRIGLVYEISEGQRVDVSQVLLAGYRYTRPGVIRRQVSIKPNGPLREGDVIATQERLYNLAIFDRVQVAPQNPSGTYPDKNVVVDVEEGKRYTVSYGFGFEAQRLASTTNATQTTLTASPLGIFEVSKINVGGRAHTISLKLRGSTLEYQGLLSYTAPDFLTYPSLNLIITGFADKASYVNTFTATRYEGSAQIVENITPSTSLTYQYFYRHVTASNLQVSVEEVPLFSQPTKVSGFETTWIRDRRNNPADATRGTYNMIDTSVATRSLGGTATYLRIFAQNSSFTPLGKSLVFARSASFGIEEPFNGSAEDDIPLPERFFAGGGTSIRGFALDQAGPRDPTTGFPVGGLAQLSFNQELRFPMHLPWIGNRLGGTVFYDAGNVFTDIHHVSLRYTPLPPPSGCQPGTTLLQSECPNLNYFSHTVGFGFRYGTPIGPVRLDLAYQINPPSFESLNTATNLPQTNQLPHFQFFFNIGSIF